LTSAVAGQPGISRAPAREAHARLHQDGLVRIRLRRGVCIRRKPREDIPEMIFALAGCGELKRIADGLVLHMCAVRRRAMAEADRAFRSVADHLGIVEALESGDPGLAVRRAMDHTLRLHDHVGRLWRRSAARGAPAKPARTSAGHLEESPA